jgi:hypothetical protein
MTIPLPGPPVPSDRGETRASACAPSGREPTSPDRLASRLRERQADAATFDAAIAANLKKCG